MARILVWICVVLGVGATGAWAQDDTPWLVFAADKRVYTAPGLENPQVAELERAIQAREKDGHWRYFVILEPDTPELPFNKAQDVRRRWSIHKEFDPHRSFFVICILERAEVVIVPPNRLRDRLGLSPEELRQSFSWLSKLSEDERLSPASVARLAKELPTRIGTVKSNLERLDDGRTRARARSYDRYQQLGRRLQREIRSLAAKLERLEINTLELGQQDLGVDQQIADLKKARQLLARALDTVRFAPDRAAQACEELGDLLAEIQEGLDRLRDARAVVPDKLAEAERDLQRLEQELSGQDLSPERKKAIQDLRGRAKLAIIKARNQDASGRPDLALQQLDQARIALVASRRQAATAAAPEQEMDAQATETDDGLAGLLGLLLLLLFLLTAVAAHVILWVIRSRSVVLADTLHDSTQRMSDRLKQEVHSLRRLYVTASRPAGLTVPSELLSDPPPTPKRYTGTTAEHLARCRSRLEELHGMWRSLEQALLRHEIWRQEDGIWTSFYTLRNLRQAIRVLERVPVRNLPVTRVRECAQRLERIASSPSACETLLEEGAVILQHAEASLDRALLAGQSTRSLNDDYADLVERTLEAAALAPAEPVGASQWAKVAARSAAQLEERVNRTLEIAIGRDQAVDKLETLRTSHGIEGRLPDAQQDLSALVTWSYHLADKVTQALDQGGREQAERGLHQAVSLIQDVEALSGGDPDLVDQVLPKLREELHQAHETLTELQKLYAPESWEDLESALHRAAAWIELLAVGGESNGRVPRVQARIQAIRTTLLEVSSRRLQLEGERQHVQEVLATLQARTESIRNGIDREADWIGAVTADAFDTTAAALESVAEEARREDGLAVWEELLVDLKTIEGELGDLTVWIGDEMLRGIRVENLKSSLRKGIREVGDPLTRLIEKRPGAESHLEFARKALAQSESLLEPKDEEAEIDVARALTYLQQGVRAVYEARDICDHRGLRDLVPDRGITGDAQHAIFLAGRELGHAHRLYTIGLAPDAAEGWKLLEEARVCLRTDRPEQPQDPYKTLELAGRAFWIAIETITAASAREAQNAEEDLATRRNAGQYQRQVRRRCRELIRRAEHHRRSRFEILGLGEEPDGDVDAVNLDEDEDDGELAALDEAVEDEPEADAEAEPEADDSAEPEPQADSEQEEAETAIRDESAETRVESAIGQTSEPSSDDTE